MTNKTKNLCEAALSIAIIVLLVLLINPFSFWMPGEMEMTILLVLVLAFIALAAFIVREKARDEREDQHRLMAGRVAFLAGSVLALIGIIYQTINGELDYWLIYVLVVMVFTKLVARIYGDTYQ